MVLTVVSISALTLCVQLITNNKALNFEASCAHWLFLPIATNQIL